jgi:hypothetical protein
MILKMLQGKQMAWKFVVEEFVLQLQGLEPKEWAVEGLIQACDAINAGIEVISLEIVRIANTDTKDHQVQDVVEEEDIILKIGIEIASMIAVSMIVVTDKSQHQDKSRMSIR